MPRIGSYAIYSQSQGRHNGFHFTAKVRAISRLNVPTEGTNQSGAVTSYVPKKDSCILHMVVAHSHRCRYVWVWGR